MSIEVKAALQPNSCTLPTLFIFGLWQYTQIQTHHFDAKYTMIKNAWRNISVETRVRRKKLKKRKNDLLALQSHICAVETNHLTNLRLNKRKNSKSTWCSLRWMYGSITFINIHHADVSIYRLHLPCNATTSIFFRLSLSFFMFLAREWLRYEYIMMCAIVRGFEKTFPPWCCNLYDAFVAIMRMLLSFKWINKEVMQNNNWIETSEERKV